MELDTHKTIEKIAKKIKCKDVAKKLAMAKEINELAKLIIGMRKRQNVKGNNLYESVLRSPS